MRCAALAACVVVIVAPLATGAAEERPKATEPVEKNGLSLSVRPTKATFAPGEAVGVEILLKNTSDKPLALWGTKSSLGWRPSTLTFVFRRVGDKDRVIKLREGSNPRIMSPVSMGPQTLAPGKSVTMTCGINQWAWWREQGKLNRLGAGGLQAGEWHVTVELNAKGGFGPNKGWIGSITSKPARVTVATKAEEKD
jgi:hypothetical protein